MAINVIILCLFLNLILLPGNNKLFCQEANSSAPPAVTVAEQAAEPLPQAQLQDNVQQAQGPASGDQATMPNFNPAPAISGVSSSRETGSVSQISAVDIQKNIKTDGGKISLDLKGIDILELLRILSLKMGVTIVPSKSVGGRVNVFLNNLDLNDAFEVILISQDLACDKNNKIINVMTAAEYERLYGKKYNEKRMIESIKLSYAKPATVFGALNQIKSEVGKLIVDEATGTIIMIDIPEKIELMKSTVVELDAVPDMAVFDIKYSTATDVKTQLSSLITSGPGEVIVDERSNKVMVTDLPEKMNKIRRVFKAIDTESRQVFIEAEILQITYKDEYQRGIEWDKIMKDNQLRDLTLKAVFPAAPSWTTSPLLTADYGKISAGVLARDDFNVAIKFLSTLGDVKVLSRPRIAAISNQEAKILIGVREAYITQSQSQAESTTVTSENVQFIDVGVKLSVMPIINKDDYITMKIKPEVSAVQQTITTSLGSRVPIVETSEAETTIKIKDGTMIMIAGLMKEEKREDISGIPYLSRLPVIGALFGGRADLRKKTEVVVFMTPYIISGDQPMERSEYEDLVPPQIVPKDKSDQLIRGKLKELNAPQDTGMGPRTREGSIYATPLKGASQEAVKMKGVKDF